MKHLWLKPTKKLIYYQCNRCKCVAAGDDPFGGECNPPDLPPAEIRIGMHTYIREDLVKERFENDEQYYFSD